MKNKQLNLIYAIVLIDIIAGSIMWVVLPQFVKHTFKPELYMAIGTALFVGIQLFTAPLLGKLSDIVGRKPIFVISAVGTFVANLCLLPRNVWAYLSNRGIDGITNGVYASVKSSITDISTEKELKKNIGIQGTIVSMGFVLGPVLAACILYLGNVSDKNATEVLITTGITISFLNIVLSFIFKETLASQKQLKIQEVRQEVGKALAIHKHFQRLRVFDKEAKGLFYLVVLQCFLSLSLGYYSYFITFMAISKLQLQPSDISLFFVYFGFLSIITNTVFYAYIIEHISFQKWIRIFAFVGFLIHIGYVFSESSLLLLYIMISVDCLTISFLPSMFDGLIAEKTNDETRGEVFGIVQAINGLMGFATTVVLGGLSLISLTLPFYWFAVCLVPLFFFKHKKEAGKPNTR